MPELLAAILLLVAVVLVFLFWRKAHIRQLARDRLTEALPVPVVESAAAPLSVRPFVRTHWVLPWLGALILVAVLVLAVGLSLIFAVTLGLVAGLLLTQLELMRIARKTHQIEAQLADAIDLMIGTLHAGGGALAALEQAVEEARAPLRPQLEEVLGRIRYGDDPQAVLRALLARVPLETFRLFTAVLSVHWEVGGSLTSPLAIVGHTIRDRIQLSRRLRSLTTQARASVIAVLGLTYFIALIMWRNDPEHMRQFLATSIGQFLVAGAVLLQAVGIVWSAALSRMRA